MPTQEEKLKKLGDILKVVDEGVTKREFLETIQNIINLVKQSEIRIIKDNSNSVKVSSAIRKLENLGRRIEMAIKEQDGGMKRLDEKVKSVKDGLPGKAGRNVDESKVIREVLAKTPTPRFIVSSEELRDMLEKLIGKERIDKSAIRGLDEALEGAKAKTGMAVFGGNRPIQIQEGTTIKTKVARLLKFTGATITQDKDGTTNIAVAGGTPVSEEVPTNSGDDLNFTIANTPATGTFKLYRGGSRITETEGDYTLTVAALVLTVALDTANGETLYCDYNY